MRALFRPWQGRLVEARERLRRAARLQGVDVAQNLLRQCESGRPFVWKVCEQVLSDGTEAIKKGPRPLRSGGDPTMVKAPEAKTRGYDAGKKIAGRKRHIAVDTDGRLLMVNLTPADISDSAGVKRSWTVCASAGRG